MTSICAPALASAQLSMSVATIWRREIFGTATVVLLTYSVSYSHSILSTHRNALIYQRKFFLLTVKARLSSRQNFSLMISKENSRDSNSATFQRLSTTIGRYSCRRTM
jgi:hypothetical protein